MKKTIIYARVSTDQQSHDSQLLELSEYVQRRGWTEVTQYTDKASGAKFSRQGLDALMSEVRRGRVERVVVYKLDRLGRSLSHLAGLIAEFTTYGTSLVATSQGIDTTDANPSGKLQLHILMAVAEFEKAIIVERVNAGLAAARAKGVVLGRPAKLFKFREQVADLMKTGIGARLISRQLGIPLSSACKIIKDVRAAMPSAVTSSQATATT